MGEYSPKYDDTWNNLECTYSIMDYELWGNWDLDLGQEIKKETGRQLCNFEKPEKGEKRKNPIIYINIFGRLGMKSVQVSSRIRSLD